MMNNMTNKLIPLGIYGGVPSLNSGCIGYLLIMGGKTILIDCGTGVASGLQKYVEFKDIDIIIITHLHFDHFTDIFYISNALNVLSKFDMNVKESNVKVYLPFNGEENSLEWKIISEGTDFSLEKLENLQLLSDTLLLKTTLTNHNRANYALLFNDIISDKKIGFTGDTGSYDLLDNFFMDSDILVSEASLLEKYKTNTNYHMTVKEACALGEINNVKLNLLTHFWYSIPLEEYEKEINNEISQLIEKDKIYSI